MAEVFDIATKQPHFVVHTDDGNSHVIPHSLVRSWAEDPDKADPLILKAIILEWLDDHK